MMLHLAFDKTAKTTKCLAIAAAAVLALLLSLSMGAGSAFADSPLAVGSLGGASLESQAAQKVSGATVSVAAKMQGKRWQEPVAAGATSGKEGGNLKLQALNMQLGGTALTGDIKYRLCIENEGWTKAAKNGNVAGHVDRKKSVVALKAWLAGEVKTHYDVFYRVYLKGVGWTSWAKGRGIAGAENGKAAIQGVQVVLSPKTARAAGRSAKAVSVRYDAHVETDGWQQWVADGQTAGTEGRALRIEALNVLVSTGKFRGGVIYRAHVQDIGWQRWKKDGGMAGTMGQGLRMEAVQMKLTGAIATRFSLYYRVHVENIGWLDWAKDGQKAGTSGAGLRMESVQVKGLKKTAKAPGSTAVPYAAGRWPLLEAQYRTNTSVNQLLEVRYTGGSNAQVYLRQRAGTAWKTVLACSGYVGRLGIGQAREWVARTPEGDFGITGAFGISPNPGAKLPYVHVTDDLYWCSDPQWYNQLISVNDHPHACTGEHLIDYWPHYKYGLFFDYNQNPVRLGAGSAFFFHCTGGAPYTAGCIAVSEPNMVTIVRTVTSGARLLIFPN